MPNMLQIHRVQYVEGALILILCLILYNASQTITSS